MPAARTRIQDLTADILSGIEDGIVMISSAGVIVIWNRAAEELTGIPAGEALGKTAASVFAENAPVLSQIEKTVASGRSYSDYESELRITYGQPLPVGLLTNVLIDKEGRRTGVILTIRDQRSIKDLKERMRRSDRLAALGKIAVGIAHEVKNPLVGIKGAAQLMKSELRSGMIQKEDRTIPGTTNLDEYIEVILKEADRLNNVLEGILDFTRIKHEQKACNVHSILDRALLLNEESARQCKISLSRQYDPSLPDVICNRDQLLQVFLNIIKNAIEAMPSGGTLTIMTRMSDLFTSVQADGVKHRLMVAKVVDTGAGIKPENLHEIFTPFFTTKDKGVGLGLALSYQIVQEHLGTIRVESQENQGTTFSVYLPLER